MTRPGQTIQIANAANRSNELPRSAGKCGQIYGGRNLNCCDGLSIRRYS